MKRTAFYEIHRSLGGKIVEFGGFEMPVQYTGIIDEHLAVRNGVGVFDVSHMGEFEVGGERRTFLSARNDRERCFKTFQWKSTILRDVL